MAVERHGGIEFPQSYVNGNYVVQIYGDGTKVRANNDKEFVPQFPESIDLKICSRCTGPNCPMCHERSGPDGKFAYLDDPILDTIQPYTELAIGGGNPLEHPDLIEFLQRMRQKNVICNITVNQYHLMKQTASVLSLYEAGLVNGIGISVNSPTTKRILDVISSLPNAVVHVIAGIVDEPTLRAFANRNIKLLILGYKTYGRGKELYQSHGGVIENQISGLKYSLNTWMKDAFPVIAFDNLALEQLDVKNMVSEAQWNNTYMGDDGQFTMYIDLVERKFAKNSTSFRMPIAPLANQTVEELFSLVKKATNDEEEQTSESISTGTDSSCDTDS